MGMAASFQATASQTLEDEVTETKDSIFTEKRTPIGVGAAIVSRRVASSLLLFLTMRFTSGTMEFSYEHTLMEGKPMIPSLCTHNDGRFNFGMVDLTGTTRREHSHCEAVADDATCNAQVRRAGPTDPTARSTLRPLWR